MCEYDGSDVSLYDLDKDRAETKNIASDHPQLVEALKSKLLAWHQDMPPDNGATFQLKAGKRK